QSTVPARSNGRWTARAARKNDGGVRGRIFWSAYDRPRSVRAMLESPGRISVDAGGHGMTRPKMKVTFGVAGAKRGGPRAELSWCFPWVQLQPPDAGSKVEVRSPSGAAVARFSFLTVFLAVAFSLIGCTDGDIVTSYGSRGGLGSSSVNGTTVLGEMFKQAGHQVESRRALTPYLRDADTIVWVPDNFNVPGPAVRDWLERWLAEREGR